MAPRRLVLDAATQLLASATPVGFYRPMTFVPSEAEEQKKEEHFYTPSSPAIAAHWCMYNLLNPSPSLPRLLCYIYRLSSL